MVCVRVCESGMRLHVCVVCYFVGMGCMPARDGSLSMEGGGGGTPPSSTGARASVIQQHGRDEGHVGATTAVQQ